MGKEERGAEISPITCDAERSSLEACNRGSRVIISPGVFILYTRLCV